MHKIGNSVRDLVTAGGAVLSGYSMKCGRCKKNCVIDLSGRTSMGSSIWEIKEIKGTLFCPYCGSEQLAEAPGHINDSRQYHED